MADINLQFGVASFIGYNCARFFVLSMVELILHGALNVFKRCITVTLSILMVAQEAGAGTIVTEAATWICCYIHY